MSTTSWPVPYWPPPGHGSAGKRGLLLGAATFTVLVGVLVASAAAASSDIDPTVRARIDAAVRSASQRRFVGRYVHRVGDDHPWSTAIVAAVISPVLAVLLARMIHPTQKLIRTGTIAVLAYGLAFSLFYTGLGTSAAAAI